MIGLDTNVLLRFILKDDPAQTPAARRFLQSLTPDNPGWVGIANVLEIVWVLSNSKNMDRREVSRAITSLLFLDTVIVEQVEVLVTAVQLFDSSRADFADCLIAVSARAAGCSKTVTFDRIAARDTGMDLLGA